MPDEPSNFTRAAKALGLATAFCAFCGAANRPRQDGPGEVEYLESIGNGLLLCKVCGKTSRWVAHSTA